MERLKKENKDNDFLKNKFENYSKTYLANALALREGKKIFSKERLLDYLENHTPYKELSYNESFKELKGGIE